MANNEKQDKLKDVWSIWECNYLYKISTRYRKNITTDYIFLTKKHTP